MEILVKVTLPPAGNLCRLNTPEEGLKSKWITWESLLAGLLFLLLVRSTN